MTNSPSLDELNNSHSALDSYYKAVLDYLNDPTKAPPLMSDFIGNVQYVELLTSALNGTGGQYNFSNASKVDSIHRFAGVSRDYSFRNKTRLDYYAEAQNSTSSDIAYMKFIKDRNVALLTGMSNNV